jgi:hypothetical protein
VVRRRRDVTAGAPSSGSRVILCPLHHVTPADGAPRVASTACSSQTIGCQTALPGPQVQVPRLASLARGDVRQSSRAQRGICTSPIRMGETRTPHLLWRRRGVSNRSDPMIEWMRYGASPRNPDPAPPCPASSDR